MHHVFLSFFCFVLASLLGAQTFEVLLMQQNVALLDVHGRNQVTTRSKMGRSLATMVYDFILVRLKGTLEFEHKYNFLCT